MDELPDYYMDMGVDPTATQPEIEKVYALRAARLRNSKVEDAPEELAEVEAAYVVLHDPASRASYDAKLRAADAEDEKKDAEMNALSAEPSSSQKGKRLQRMAGCHLGSFELFQIAHHQKWDEGRLW